MRIKLPSKRLTATTFVALAVLLLGAWLIVKRSTGDFDASARELLARSGFVRDNAGPEYQDEVLAALGPNRLNGPFYRFDEMLDEAVVVEEPQLPDSVGGRSVLFALEFDGTDTVAVRPSLGTSLVTMADGLLSVRQDADDYLELTAPVSIPRDAVGSILVRARTDRTADLTFAWAKEADPDDPWNNQFSIDLVGDGAFHIYEINATNVLKRGLNSGESLSSLFLKPSDRPGAQVDLDFVRFVSKRSKYILQPRGASYETVGREMRRVLYMLPTQSLRFAVEVPESSPTLDFGTAILMNDAPVTFVAMVSEEGQRDRTIYRQRIESADSWQDARLDLEPWSGRNVEITLRVEERDNVAFWSSPTVSSQPRERFNVIIILEDALRADRLSTYGYQRETSPAKDSLMDEGGIVFNYAFSQATKTRPSVPSFMTSLLPTATGVWGWSDALREEYLTLAEVMRSQGFATASFIQNGNAGPYVGLHQGFDVIKDEETIGQETQEILGKQTVDWLRGNRDRNRFMYLHVADPHGAYDPPPPYDRWYRESSADGSEPVAPADYLDPEWVKQPTDKGRGHRYDGEVRHNDARFAGFVEALDSLGMLENTLLILTADHGEYLGEHGRWEHQPPGLMEVIRVPLMFHFPKRFAEPKRISEPVQLLDVMPTILELADVETGSLLLHGSSLVDLIEGRKPSYWENRLIVSEEPTSLSRNDLCPCGSFVFRDLHLIASPGLHGLPRILDRRAFNYRGERTENRASFSPVANYLAWIKHKRVMAKLQADNLEAWLKWAKAGEGDILTVDPEVLERLRGLGYIN